MSISNATVVSKEWNMFYVNCTRAMAGLNLDPLFPQNGSSPPPQCEQNKPTKWFTQAEQFTSWKTVYNIITRPKSLLKLYIHCMLRTDCINGLLVYEPVNWFVIQLACF